MPKRKKVNLALQGGGAQTAAEVSTVRTHANEGRGSCRVERMGWKWALDNMQRKRNLARLRQAKSLSIPFDRAKLLAQSPIPQRVLLRHAKTFSTSLLAYNWWLFVHSKAPSIHYALFQSFVRACGPKALRGSSMLWNLVSAS